MRTFIVGFLVVVCMTLALTLAMQAARQQRISTTVDRPSDASLVTGRPAARLAGSDSPADAADSGQRQASAGDGPELPSPSLEGAPGLLLFHDTFAGTGPLLAGNRREDVHGDGWQVTDQSRQPRRDGGVLVSGGAASTASLQLPPISPHGEITITARLLLRGSAAVSLGLAKAEGGFLGTENGPFVQVTGDGGLRICTPAGDRTQANLARTTGATDWPMTLVLHHRLWNRTLRVSADGVHLASLTLPKTTGDANRWLTIAFDAANTQGSPAIDALRVDYVPVPRPAKLVPHRTVTVTDTTREGILAAIHAANATSGPDNIIEVSIPKGDYVFTVPQGTQRDHVFSTYGLKHMIIDWNGSSITIAEPDLGFQCLSDGNNVTVRNIASVDYPQDNLPFTQGTVRAIDTATRTFDLEIDAGFPQPDNAYFSSRTPKNSEHWGQLVDAEHPGRQPAGVKREYWIKEIRRLENGLFRYTLNESQMPGFRIGSRFADCPRSGNEIFRVFTANHVRLENITGHSCPNFWSMIYFTNISYHNVQVRLKPGRLMTANGDLVTGVDNLLWMERCRFEGNADDICHQFRGRGTFITDTEFRDNRRFGVWFNTGGFGVVKDCLFDGVGFHAISGMKEPGMDEGGQFGSRNIICVGNRIRNVRDPGIFLNSCHTRSDGSPHWNTYWRLLRNSSSTPLRIHNATDVRLVDNTSESGAPARIDVDPQKTRAIDIVSTRP